MRLCLAESGCSVPPGEPVLRSPREIAGLREAGLKAARALAEAVAACRPGVATAAIESVANAAIRAQGASPALQGLQFGAQQRPFPCACCVSVNEEALHTLPGPRRLRAGDLVTIDLALRTAAGWCTDVATSVVVGSEPLLGEADGARRLVAATRRALAAAADIMRPGVAWSRVVEEIEAVAWDEGFGVVADYVGHGVGRDVHEPPIAPAAHERRGAPLAEDFILQAGMVIAVEPVLTLSPDGERGGRTATRTLDDGWTVVTADRSLACHEEHTIAVTEAGPVTLTAE